MLVEVLFYVNVLHEKCVVVYMDYINLYKEEIVQGL